MRSTRFVAVAAALMFGASSLAGCGGDSSAAAVYPAPDTTKISANFGASGDIESALTVAGVPSAAKWTKRIEEHRPYTDDPALPLLRTGLVKDKAPQDVIDKILATLRP